MRAAVDEVQRGFFFDHSGGDKRHLHLFMYSLFIFRNPQYLVCSQFAVELDWIRELDGELVRIRLARGGDQEHIAGEWLCTSRGAVRLLNFAHTTQKEL